MNEELKKCSKLQNLNNELLEVTSATDNDKYKKEALYYKQKFELLNFDHNKLIDKLNKYES